MVLLFDMPFQGEPGTQHFSADKTAVLLLSSSDCILALIASSPFQLHPVCTNHTAIRASTFDDRKNISGISETKKKKDFVSPQWISFLMDT